MKKRINIGRLISSIGTCVIGVGLALNGLEILSVTPFRILVLVGVLLQIAALCVALKHDEL